MHYYLDALYTITTYQYEYYVTRTTTWMPVTLVSAVNNNNSWCCEIPYIRSYTWNKKKSGHGSIY